MDRRLPAALVALCLAVTGCTKGSTKDGREVAVEISDAGCQPEPASVPAGPVTFRVTNKNASAVTEAELKQGGTILGEKENLAPGLSGSFTLHLKPGTYAMVCPNAKTDSWTFTVSGTAAEAAPHNPAVDAYKQYVIGEVAKLVPATKRFTDAVRAGDLNRAKELYSPARYFYEEIEPVAESFGDLDPQIDARVDNVDDPSQWTGFHRIEKALWQDRTTAGLKPLADKLDADVAKLRGLVATVTYQPAQLANGATELLNEVAAHKITGEEDRYSHTDLSDFQANVDGAKKAFYLLVPTLKLTDPDLVAAITQKFADVQAALGRYGKDIDYSTVDDPHRRVLTQKVDALAEPLSQVAAKVAS